MACIVRSRRQSQASKVGLERAAVDHGRDVSTKIHIIVTMDKHTSKHSPAYICTSLVLFRSLSHHVAGRWREGKRVRRTLIQEEPQ